MFSKVANAILFFRLDIRMGLLYITLCIGKETKTWLWEPNSNTTAVPPFLSSIAYT